MGKGTSGLGRNEVGCGGWGGGPHKGKGVGRGQLEPSAQGDPTGGEGTPLRTVGKSSMLDNGFSARCSLRTCYRAAQFCARICPPCGSPGSLLRKQGHCREQPCSSNTTAKPRQVQGFDCSSYPSQPMASAVSLNQTQHQAGKRINGPVFLSSSPLS